MDIFYVGAVGGGVVGGYFNGRTRVFLPGNQLPLYNG